jgi:DNA polymerase-3 subunit delta'
MPDGSPDDIRAELRQARQAGRVHSAYLLEGPSGIGKSTTALWFARLLLCSQDGPDPCESCPECHRSMAREHDGAARPEHPDLFWVEPEGGLIRIDQIRALQRSLGLMANEGGWRIGVLLSADRLRIEAANALLKTLEEPPPRSTLILVADRAEVLPRTVRSRLIRLRFLPEGETAIAETLRAEGLEEEEAALAASLGGGTVSVAREWAAEYLEPAREFAEWIEGARERTDSEILDFAESFRGGGEEIRQRVELFLAVHASVSRRRVEAAIREDRSQAIDAWLHHSERGIEARHELLRRNLNPQMLVESLVLDLKENSPTV